MNFLFFALIVHLMGMKYLLSMLEADDLLTDCDTDSHYSLI